MLNCTIGEFVLTRILELSRDIMANPGLHSDLPDEYKAAQIAIPEAVATCANECDLVDAGEMVWFERYCPKGCGEFVRTNYPNLLAEAKVNYEKLCSDL